MSDFERQKQQRFDAALAFATNPTWVQSELRPQPIWKAVELADELIAELEETKTKALAAARPDLRSDPYFRRSTDDS